MNWLRLLLAATTLASALSAQPTAAQAMDACANQASWQQVLKPQREGLPAEAAGHWLARGWLLWPGLQLESGQRVVLAHSAHTQLALSPGAAVQGAEQRIVLEPSALPAELAGRTRWLPHGMALQLPAAQQAQVPRLLTGQLLLLKEDGQGHVLQATRLQLPGVIDDIYAADEARGELGTRVDMRSVTFKLWAPTAQAVSVCVQDRQIQPMRREPGSGIWRTQLGGLHFGRSYTYLVDVQVPGVGLVRNRVTDPYSLSLTQDSQASVVLDLDAPMLSPEGWDAARRPPPLAAAIDQVIYELHVRDFSMSDASVPQALRGKYLAFAQADTAGVRHLKALAAAGLTHVHLLPVFDFASVPDVAAAEPKPQGAPDSEAQQDAVAALKDRDAYNWGYDPWHFGAPEGSYATSVADPGARVLELRAMVQALHAMGLRVGMDVVYNHMSASGQHEKSVLDRIVPGYYHRLNATGGVENSTCCANTATEHRMMARLMIDTAVRWVKHYRIDAFRFDLMGHQPREAMERLQKAVDAAAGRHVHLIGEGWNFGEVADGKRFVQASQLSLQGSGIASFSDRARDAVRGGGVGDAGVQQIIAQGWANGLHHDANERASGKASVEDFKRAADLVRVGLAGTLASYEMRAPNGQMRALSQFRYGNQPAGFAAEPAEVVNYVENHDNQTLFDANVFKLPRHTSAQDRARVQTLASATVLFAQGIAYVHAGQELLRSKSMDRNSYDSGDWFNRLDFTAQDNHFGTGLPPRWDNAESWPWMKPLLADAPRIRVQPAHIAWARDSFLDLLRIRNSSTLFRLRSAADVRERLVLHNTGPQQQPALLVGQLLGQVRGVAYAGAGYGELLYFIHAGKTEARFHAPALAREGWRLHPVHAQGADARAREALVDVANGNFHIPPRTAVVFVRD